MIVVVLIVLVFLGVFIFTLFKYRENNKMNIIVNGRKYSIDVRKSNVPDDYLSKIDSLYNSVKSENKIWEEQFNELRKLNNNGVSYEKVGDLENAILSYRNAVEFGRSASKLNWCNYAASVLRLAILLRKKKRFDEELEIIKVALQENLSIQDRDYWEKRLKKAEQLKSKNDEK